MASIGISTTAAYVLLSNLTCTWENTSLEDGDYTLDPGDNPYLAVVRGESPASMVEAALAALGGIERFVKSGDDVIIKPNICVSYRTYEYAATTNPEVVGATVNLCVEAGAKSVRVMDCPFSGSPEEAYETSSIGDAVRSAGGTMETMSEMKYSDITIPKGKDINSWSMYRDVVEADVFINVPIAKHHNNTRLSLGMKNLIGVTKDMSGLHGNLSQRIADITSRVRPDLTIVDAVRILVTHGPQGGSLSDVKMANTIIASHDIVAADSYAATLFDLTGADIEYIRLGADMKLGTMDLDSIEIEEIDLSV